MFQSWMKATGALIAGFILLLVILMPPIDRTRPTARSITCRSNLKQLSTALLVYAADYDDRLPPAGAWTRSIHSYRPAPGPGDRAPTPIRRLRCPSANVGGAAGGYALHSNISGRTAVNAPSCTGSVLLFESDLHGWSAAGGREAVVRPGRHPTSGAPNGNNYAFLDGHVKWLREAPDFGNRADSGRVGNGR